MSGGARGIGREIALAAARPGASVAMLAKTAEPDLRIPGMIFSAAKIDRGGGWSRAPVDGDVRKGEDTARVVDETVEQSGGADIDLNNASSINLHPTKGLPLNRLDLVLDINIRGSLALTRAVLPYLWESDHARILTLSPPVNLEEWIGSYPAYVVGKFGMSVRGMVSGYTLVDSDVLRSAGVADVSGYGGEEPLEIDLFL